MMTASRPSESVQVEPKILNWPTVLVCILAGEDGALREVGIEVGYFKSPVAVVEPGVGDFPLLA
jgi:hypothetical protein